MAATLAGVLLVEIGSLAILALCAALQWRAGALRAFLRDAALIGLAGWMAEDLCIRAFDFYGYAPGWTARLDRVPALIGVIWPFVILSARDVARALWGESRWLPLQAAVLICFDAALVEPVAVRAGLWSWSEQGIFSVPLVGIAGWGAFGAVCLLLLRARPLLVLAAPFLVNAALVALWWGAFRWGPRRELVTTAPLLIALCASCALIWSLRHKRGALPFEVALPRAAAALLFFLLAALHGDARLWGYAAVIALPWLWVARLRRRPALEPA
jgi:hypothetical protein